MYTSSESIALRLSRFIPERVIPNVYTDRSPLAVEFWDVDDEPVPFATAIAQEYRPLVPGAPWGRPWGTTWLRITGELPNVEVVAGNEFHAVVDLGFSAAQVGFQAEGLVFSPDGTILQGLEPRNFAVPLTRTADGHIELYVEAASNPDVGDGFTHWTPTPLGRKRTAGAEPIYRLGPVELATWNLDVWELLQDVWTLRGLASELPESSSRRAKIFAGLDRLIDLVDPSDVAATSRAGRESLAPLLSAPASSGAHHVYAVGHAHIDSAWLWPVRETIRKCARTFSNVLAMMDRDPDFVFACSSAQQFAWIREFYPPLFERIRARVAEGRFVPVGGMWVESDTNMPSGESLVRQFLVGKAFFREEFDYEPKEVWLPDSFGYTGALPQLAVAAGFDSFLTQKLSWNETNRFPHSSFLWEGIDGSRIFTHFPPVDTYNSDLSGEELARSERQFVEKDRGNSSLVPFGFGDGGGGPTREMMAAARRTASLEGSPRVTVASPRTFFEAARDELGDPGVWSGELYLEFHRGTYTSQARTKSGNRRSERLLHEAELWAATATVQRDATYPYDQLTSAWKTVLLQQFHDILPGSSIGWVHDQAEENYARIAGELDAVIGDALGILSAGGSAPVAFNSSPFPVSGIPGYSAGSARAEGEVSARDEGGEIVIDNGLLELRIDGDGLIASLRDVESGREVIPDGTRGNLLQLFRDTPKQWDAWDIDREYARVGEDLTAADSVRLRTSEAGTAAVDIVRRFGESSVRQTITVSGGARSVEIETIVDWHETQKLLKLAFPVDVSTTKASSEIQFGHIERATHTNTSWDQARFETVAHRWIHVADASFGVGVTNTSHYGHDVVRTPKQSGGTYSTLRQSLLRAPLFPDPEADQGTHHFRASLVVGSVAQTVEEAYRLNFPLREAPGEAIAPLVTVTGDGFVIETVKLAEDRSGDVIVRGYEALGGRATPTITTGFSVHSIDEVDLLERTIEPRALRRVSDGAAQLEVGPFQVVTLRLAQSSG
jgi:alpha-mannosidase